MLKMSRDRNSKNHCRYVKCKLKYLETWNVLVMFIVMMKKNTGSSNKSLTGSFKSYSNCSLCIFNHVPLRTYYTRLKYDLLSYHWYLYLKRVRIQQVLWIISHYLHICLHFTWGYNYRIIKVLCQCGIDCR